MATATVSLDQVVRYFYDVGTLCEECPYCTQHKDSAPYGDSHAMNIYSTCDILDGDHSLTDCPAMEEE
jgi:hypothetical protein